MNKAKILEYLDLAIVAASHHEKLASLKECPGHICIAYAARKKLAKVRAHISNMYEEN